MLGDVASDGLCARSRIPLQGTHGGVPRAGKQDRRVGPVLGSVGQRGVAQLVERPPAGHCTEELGGATVRQTGATGDWTQVDARHRPRRQAIGHEDRSGRTASQEPREQERRPGLPEHPLGRPALARDTARRSRNQT